MHTMPTLRRSLLYIPGDREAMIAKAATRGADGVILNLEDAVAPANKPLARATVAHALAEVSFGAAEVIVRINPPDTRTGYEDLLALAACGAHALLLPKVGSAEEVRFVAWTVARQLALRELPADSVRLMCMIESAAGVQAAPEIAACHPGVAALIFGANDLSEDLGCAPEPAGQPLLYAASRVVLAARAAGIDAVDSPHMDIGDVAGLARAAGLARELGFVGKSAIHPNQVAAINNAFSPAPEQIAWARRVLTLAPDGDPARLGAALLDGQLIEAPHLARAGRILAAAERLGL